VGARQHHHASVLQLRAIRSGTDPALGLHTLCTRRGLPTWYRRVTTWMGFFMAFWVKDRSRLSRKRDGRGGVGAAHARDLCVLSSGVVRRTFALGACIGASSFWRTWRPHAHHFSADSLFRLLFRSKPKSHKHDKKFVPHCIVWQSLLFCLNINRNQEFIRDEETNSTPPYIPTD
jgi:hypothetical protein